MRKESDPDKQPNPQEEIQTLISRLRLTDCWCTPSHFRVWGNQSPSPYLCDEWIQAGATYSPATIPTGVPTRLWELGRQTELLPLILKGLINKGLELESEPVQMGERLMGEEYLDFTTSRKALEVTILGFGAGAVPHLNALNNKFAREMARKIIRKTDREENIKKVKELFTHLFELFKPR